MVSIVPRQKCTSKLGQAQAGQSHRRGRYLHTQQTTSFPSGCSLLIRIRDDWCTMIKASPRPRDWLGKGWISSLSAAGWSASSGCDFGSILTNSIFFPQRYTAGTQTTRINLNGHCSSSRSLSSVRGGLLLPVADLSILHLLIRTGWELQIYATYFETNRRFF